MHIRHVNPATDTLGVEGHEFAAVRPGVFDVPDEIGYRLLEHGVWTRYTGEEPYEIQTPSGATLTDLSDAAEEEARRQQAEAGEPDWFEEGRKAAEASQERTLPAALAGVHPRSRDPRRWFEGYDSHRPSPEATTETTPAE